MFHRLSLKSVISARTLKDCKTGQDTYETLSVASQTHWKYLMPLDTPIPWNQKLIRHGEWWLDPQNVLQGDILHPREHKILIFTDASNAGWGAHLNQESTGGLWS